MESTEILSESDLLDNEDYESSVEQEYDYIYKNFIERLAKIETIQYKRDEDMDSNDYKSKRIENLFSLMKKYIINKRNVEGKFDLNGLNLFLSKLNVHSYVNSFQVPSSNCIISSFVIMSKDKIDNIISKTKLDVVKIVETKSNNENLKFMVTFGPTYTVSIRLLGSRSPSTNQAYQSINRKHMSTSNDSIGPYTYDCGPVNYFFQQLREKLHEIINDKKFIEKYDIKTEEDFVPVQQVKFRGVKEDFYTFILNSNGDITRVLDEDKKKYEYVTVCGFIELKVYKSQNSNAVLSAWCKTSLCVSEP